MYTYYDLMWTIKKTHHNNEILFIYPLCPNNSHTPAAAYVKKAAVDTSRGHRGLEPPPYSKIAKISVFVTPN